MSGVAYGQRLRALLWTRRYAVLSALVYALMLLQTLNGQWSHDFWEHAAVVRELATNPWAPQHPQLLLPTPHVEYSPYTLAVGLLARATGLPAVNALELAGLVNLLLLLVALRVFAVTLLGGESAAFYALLFTLVLWGRRPWLYSGFFHLNMLGSGLSYPSTFSAALVFVAWALALRYLRQGGSRRLWPLALLSAVVLIVHPLSGVALFTGLGAFALASLGRTPHARMAWFGAALSLAMLLALAWPYYSFWELIARESARYHREHTAMYVGVLEQTFPLLLALPVLAARLRDDRRDPLVLLALALAALYAYGGLTGHESYGRTLPFLVLALHLALAGWLAGLHLALAGSGPALEAEVTGRSKPRDFWHDPLTAAQEATVAVRGWLASPARLAALVALVMAAYCIAAFRPGLFRSVPGQPPTYTRYAFLTRETGQYEVVITDILTSHVVPVFGGKVVSSPNPLPFVPDQPARTQDLRRFFDPAASQDERRVLLARYQARYVLINHELFGGQPALEATLEQLGAVRYRDARFTLLDTTQP